ncbi:hypothetical protein ABEY43_07125 [Priestia megaterium]
MIYYSIESDAKELFDKWVEIEKYDLFFSRNVRSVIQNEYHLPHEQLKEWMEQTKESYQQLKEIFSEIVLKKISKLIKETYEYILSKEVIIEI